MSERDPLKRFILSVGAFAPFCLVSYVFFLIVWGDIAPEWLRQNLNYRLGGDGHMFTRLQEIEEVKELDILFLGSSQAYRGFDPRIFQSRGLNTFNLGSSAQSHLQTEALLKKYLPHLAPRMVIYSVSINTFASDGVESSLDIIANARIDRHTLHMALKVNHLKTYNALIYGFYRDITHKNEGFAEPRKKNRDTYIPGGYVQTETGYFNPAEQSPQEPKWNDKQLEAFENNLSMLRERGIRFILVRAPLTDARYRSYRNNRDFDERMASYGEYYNFNHLMNLSDSLHFYDPVHLNQTGVTLFNRELIKHLELE